MLWIIVLAVAVGVLAWVGSKFGKVQKPELYWLVAPPILIVAIGGMWPLGKSFREFGHITRLRGLHNELNALRLEHPSCLRPDGECALRDITMRNAGCVARAGRRFDEWPMACALTPAMISMTRNGGLMFSLCMPSKTCEHFELWYVTEELVTRLRLRPEDATTPMEK